MRKSIIFVFSGGLFGDFSAKIALFCPIYQHQTSGFASI